jgi:hypothetical protein
MSQWRSPRRNRKWSLCTAVYSTYQSVITLIPNSRSKRKSQYRASSVTGHFNSSTLRSAHSVFKSPSPHVPSTLKKTHARDVGPIGTRNSSRGYRKLVHVERDAAWASIERTFSQAAVNYLRTQLNDDMSDRGRPWTRFAHMQKEICTFGREGTPSRTRACEASTPETSRTKSIFAVPD